MKFVATFPLETAASAAILDSSSQRKGCDAPFAAVSCAQPLPDNSTRSDDRHLGLGTRLFLLEVLDFNCELRRIIQLASGVRERPCGRIVLPARIDASARDKIHRRRIGNRKRSKGPAFP
jgi:hypothetical protein